ncbi:MAG: hypothetical protein BGO35_16275 [Burkholderiales bacterium 64-34]|nr:MAG: hypothetical protein BGO35_16275 [Burkholderiales bacterium 64-34]
MNVRAGHHANRILQRQLMNGRSMRMLTISNQSSVAKVFQAFDEHARLKWPAFHDRIVDVLDAWARCL